MCRMRSSWVERITFNAKLQCTKYNLHVTTFKSLLQYKKWYFVKLALPNRTSMQTIALYVISGFPYDKGGFKERRDDDPCH